MVEENSIISGPPVQYWHTGGKVTPQPLLPLPQQDLQPGIPAPALRLPGSLTFGVNSKHILMFVELLSADAGPPLSFRVMPKVDTLRNDCCCTQALTESGPEGDAQITFLLKSAQLSRCRPHHMVQKRSHVAALLWSRGT
jgi:hypothetical protein